MRFSMNLAPPRWSDREAGVYIVADSVGRSAYMRGYSYASCPRSNNPIFGKGWRHGWKMAANAANPHFAYPSRTVPLTHSQKMRLCESLVAPMRTPYIGQSLLAGLVKVG
jgi:hypothetical protein